MNVISIEVNCFFTILSKSYLFLEWLFLLSTERNFNFLTGQDLFPPMKYPSTWEIFFLVENTSVKTTLMKKA